MGTVRAQKRTHLAQQGSRGRGRMGRRKREGRRGESAELLEVSVDGSQGAARMTGPEAREDRFMKAHSSFVIANK